MPLIMLAIFANLVISIIAIADSIRAHQRLDELKRTLGSKEKE